MIEDDKRTPLLLSCAYCGHNIQTLCARNRYQWPHLGKLLHCCECDYKSLVGPGMKLNQIGSMPDKLELPECFQLRERVISSK